MRSLWSAFLLTCALSAQDAALQRRPFVRCVERDDGGQLDVLIATYAKGDATLVLHGAVHVADPEHYAALQPRFAAFDALLYELVAPAELRPHPGMELDPEAGDWFATLQGAFGRGLGLVEQVEHVDYRPANFVHADLTDAEWHDALERAGSSLLGEITSLGMPEPDREAEAARPKENFVAAARAGLQQHELRRAFARLLAEPDGARREPSVIIEARNERCLEVLQQQLAAGRKRLGIYYGAAHMEHLERRLVDDLGWRRTGEEWLLAWDNRASRFAPVEKGLQQKRYRARQDVDALADAVRAWRREHPDQQPTWAALRAAHGGKLPGRADGTDPWGRPYELRMRGKDCDVVCRGSDGEIDTDDDLGAAVAAGEQGFFDRLSAWRSKLDAQRRAAEAKVQQLQAQIDGAEILGDAKLHYVRHGRAPTLAELGETRRDPWGNAYRLVVTGNEMQVRSDGPDGKPDTADDVVTGRS